MTAASQFNCRAYGLTIGSALRLDELPSATGAADIVIRRAELAAEPPFLSPNGSMWWTGPNEIFYHYIDTGTFCVREGREIVIDAAPGVEDRLLRLYVLGPLLAAVLRQRGWLLLHASAVAMGGQVTAFLGGSGWGKSTMAAALHKRGHDLVADDFLAVINEPGLAPHAYPGFPQLKLWPEAAESMGDDPGQWPALHPDHEKRSRRVRDGFAQAAMPLGRLYVLAEGESLETEAVTGQQAMLELVRHGYGTRSMHKMAPAAQFERCAALLKQVPMRRLRRPRSLAALADVAALVEAEAACLSAP